MERKEEKENFKLGTPKFNNYQDIMVDDANESGKISVRGGDNLGLDRAPQEKNDAFCLQHD